MRITKDEFSRAVNALRAQINYDIDWAKKVGEVFPTAFGANLLYNNREITEGLISLLESLTGDENTKWIDYFMYECEFGDQELECKHEDGTPFTLKTPEDVYDLLESNMQKSGGQADVSSECLREDGESEVSAAMDAGIKFDKEKIKMELIPLSTVLEVAKVLTFGAKKYAPNNWMKLENAEERYRGALLRHLTAHESGERIDKESGLLHIAQVMTNAMFLLWFELEKTKNTEKQ